MLSKKNIFLILNISCCICLMFIELCCLEGDKKTLNSKNEDKKSFLVVSKNDSTKRMSKNELKENLGCEIKNVLTQCSDINKNIGKMQIKLAKIEKQLFEKIEKLIDNRAPFKKAGKVELSESFNLLVSAKRELLDQVLRIKRLNLEIDKNICLKNNEKTKNKDNKQI